MLQSAMIRKNLILLATCQGLMLSCTSLVMTTSALVGASLIANPRFHTLPLGLTYLFMMATMIPGSMLMQHYGRRVGFALGGVAGVLGGVVAAFGIYRGDFVMFCIGSALFGISNGFAQFYRFAAAEVVEPDYKSRAISFVLVGGLVAAFIGPNTARLTHDIIPNALFSVSYGFIAVFCLGVILVQLVIDIPKPSAAEVKGKKRPLMEILTKPTFMVAAVCAMIAYGTMNLLMTATPLAMDHSGLAFGQTATVIQWHIVGMFAPSFFTGSLINRFGVLKVMFTGAVILIGCTLVTLSGQAYHQYFIALVMLGVGWNFLFVGGTTLLTEVYLPAEKGVIQGINDFMVFSATAFTALTSGYFHHLLGWKILNLYAIPTICFAAAIILILGLSRKMKLHQAV